MEIDRDAMLREAIDSMKRDSSMQTETIKEKLKSLVNSTYKKALEDVKKISQDKYIERNQFNKIYFDKAVDALVGKGVE